MITNALEDKPLPVYGDGLNIRDWLHVWDHCAALDLVLHHGKPGEVYNSLKEDLINYIMKTPDIIDKP